MTKRTLFTREHDYALRIAAYLASFNKDEIISVNELSTKLRISKIFTARIVHKLRKANITGAVQGKYGGVFLKSPAENLSVWDVINAVGTDIKLNECLNEHYSCELLFGCKFHHMFHSVEKTLIDRLKQEKISNYIFHQIK